TGDVQVIDDGETGYSAVGFSAAAGQGYQNDVEFSAAGSGNTATWTFNGLTPGDYRVSATWTAHPNRATNAPFSIDGGGPILVNQELEPLPDYLQGGVNFQDLALSQTVAGTSLTVSLADAGADEFVIADAIRIELLNPLRADNGPANQPVPAEFELTGQLIGEMAKQAIADWKQVDPGAAAALDIVDIRVADLSGSILGLTSEATRTIWLDRDAAGYGWQTKQQYADQNSEAVDLLTVVTHEFGHLLGLSDLDASPYADDVMLGRLPGGTTRFAAGAAATADADPLVFAASDLLFMKPDGAWGVSDEGYTNYASQWQPVNRQLADNDRLAAVRLPQQSVADLELTVDT
ncbi:MAG: hypothetical protein VX257_12340, partial [Planctomycetota bacterium]|nr:hypothetical protein [Planctomycetota bacterium]